jgi:hypothetical protein
MQIYFGEYPFLRGNFTGYKCEPYFFIQLKQATAVRVKNIHPNNNAALSTSSIRHLTRSILITSECGR